MAIPAKFLAPEQIRYLVETAERARVALSQYVGHEVAYDPAGLQLLDEWIDRYLQHSPNPPQEVRLLWVSFLGEMFRRRHEGEWVAQACDEGMGLVILCPTERGGLYTVDVSGQVGRRIAQGMSASLAWFYTVTSIELRMD